MDSVLTSVKKMLGITEDYTHFDADLIMHINTVFTILAQLGIGPVDGFSIADASALWTDFVESNPLLESVKSYMYLRVRLLFDPPASSAIMEAINRQIVELEWRINITVDPGEEENQNVLDS